MKTIIDTLENKVLSGYKITYDEAMILADINEASKLYEAANRIREKFKGNNVDLCSIINAKSGRCSENCKYCAQSAHYNTGVLEYPLIDAEVALKMAKENEKEGVHRFSLVTSGGALSNEDFNKAIDIFILLKRETKLKLCASLGSISFEQAISLKEAGVETYHHNIETSSKYFNKICDTHTYEERINTIRNVIAAGLSVCSGGIIGMGENMYDRIEMALELRELGIKSIPINILNPIKGTPFENMVDLDSEEIVRTIALFRFILPDSFIRYAGGRSSLGDKQILGFKAGVNAALVGNYLTTVGNTIQEDIKMIKSLEMEVYLPEE